jgi:hypothetical protein
MWASPLCLRRESVLVVGEFLHVSLFSWRVAGLAVRMAPKLGRSGSKGSV